MPLFEPTLHSVPVHATPSPCTTRATPAHAVESSLLTVSIHAIVFSQCITQTRTSMLPLHRKQPRAQQVEPGIQKHTTVAQQTMLMHSPLAHTLTNEQGLPRVIPFAPHSQIS